ncbi:molybdopterin-dependent oxidoreductase [Candidatus Albibeggiatoa sp. nov. BB20]|uniref:molybdopterin-dependent oxidoreductase n=1 Tax=Candidatus Albibeggiatoa sp. nov. BB20 TaxID=3162723 RepID=UPI00336576FB
MSSVQTACPYCGVGCGVIATVNPDNSVTVKGDKTHPANFGKLCSKGSALGETLSLDDRLLYPEINAQRCDWDTALNTVAEKFKDTIQKHGADSVAFYVSGQLLTEDYYVANKLMKGFIGSGNIDTNSRLCMASSVAGHKRAFGSDTVPCNYEDLELADLIILTGSNLAWCHPVTYQRINAAKKKRPELKVINIDPRQTATCDIADQHIALKAGTDAWLFNGLLQFLRNNDHLDYEYLEQYTQGFSKALDAAKKSSGSIPIVAQQCGLTEPEVAEFYRAFAKTKKVVTVYSQGINQSSSGTDKVNSIINCHLATGKIGKVGMGAFSVTGQPNAMGGREVGALSNQLVAHTDFKPDDLDMVGRFWQTDNLAQQAGLKAVDLFEAVKQKKIKALWIMATNPLVSMPDVDNIKAALESCEFVVVSDCVRTTDTMNYAHVRLPALGWGEKDGSVTNSERCISRQRAFLPPSAEAKPDWWILNQVAQRMGFKQAFNYQSPAQIFREYAELTGFENNGKRDLDLSGLDTLTDDEYQDLAPLQWPVFKTENGYQPTARLFTDGQYFHSSKKAQLIAIEPRLPQGQVSNQFPFMLNTGRVRDQWHTMTRTGKSARLVAHIPEPLMAIHPKDGLNLGLQDGGLAEISSAVGHGIVRVQLTSSQAQGDVFIPMHWSKENSVQGSVGKLISPYFDPISGQPEFKQTPVALRSYKPEWQAFILLHQGMVLPESLQNQLTYGVKIRGKQSWRYELAGETAPESWKDWIIEHFEEADWENWLEYHDRAKGYYRYAKIIDGQLQACVFISPDEQLPARDWLQDLFVKDELSLDERINLLLGQPAKQQDDAGKIICSCFGVGKNTILKAVKEQNLTDVAQITAKLKAGGNCGSCVPELKELLAGA